MNIIYTSTLFQRALQRVYEMQFNSSSTCSMIPFTSTSEDIDLGSLSAHFPSLNNGPVLSPLTSNTNNNTYFEANNIYINDPLEWNSSGDLILEAKGNIVFRKGGKIVVKGSSSIYLKAGIENPNGTGTVIFQGDRPQIRLEGDGKAFIHYNPDKGSREHKYHNPYSYREHVEPRKPVKAYMLVNDIDDLQDINMFLHGNYALSRNIDASIAHKWNSGASFTTIKRIMGEKIVAFSGDFDGNGFSIDNLLINAKTEDSVGLFGVISGSIENHVVIENLKLQNLKVHGSHYVGGVAGEALYTDFINIEILNNCHVKGTALVGSLVGSASGITLDGVNIKDKATNIVEADEVSGLLCGAIRDSLVQDLHNICSDNQDSSLKCFGHEEAWVDNI